jgi:putative ABC transport system permease protein
MFSYYLELAVQNLKRNISLTSLMLMAIGAGIGASMTKRGINMCALSGPDSFTDE